MGEAVSGKRILVGVVVLVVLAAIIAPLVYFLTKDSTRHDGKPVTTTHPRAMEQRIDCFPEARGGVQRLTKALCGDRNCEYIPGTGGERDFCSFRSIDHYGYSVLGDIEETAEGQRVHLEQVGEVPFKSRSATFKKPVFKSRMLNNHLLQLTFSDEESNRYIVPKNIKVQKSESPDPLYDVEIQKDPFSVKIKRKSTGRVLFDTSVGGLTLTDQFLQLSTRLPSRNIYGFGENRHNSFRHDLNYTSWGLFSRDQGPGSPDPLNLYGVHPFYTCVEEDGNTHGVLLLNSNAQDYSFTPLPMLTYRTIGGVLDFYVFLGPTPENVVQQYTQAVGRPFMPPYWALGFQICRYGYKNTAEIETVVERTKTAGIPHDVQYADIDHMDEAMDFTVDQDYFGTLNSTFTELRKDGMRTIIILDPCLITNVSGYEPYERLSRVKGAIMWPEGQGILNDTKDPTGALLGFVWPKGKVVFPDFFKQETQTIWKDLIKEHREKLVFDGLWIDMNEPANFGTNQDRPWNWPESDKPYWSLKCPDDPLEDPPYRTMAAIVHDNENKAISRISNKTVCMVARQGQENQYRHYDVHSLYGWSQSEPTLSGLQTASNERGMVLSRSTFPGSGQYVGHWLGDNGSEWPQLADSIIGMLEFNLFGIPYIGADICGFFGNTTVQICKRWMQLGAFYPFSRNHNGIGNEPQDPAAMGEEVIKASRDALLTRYWLLPYLYTLFHEAHVYGNTVVRPLHHEFPTDTVALGIDKQFLWGKSLLISPILEKDQTVLKYYIPHGRWYDFYNGQVYEGASWRTTAVTSDSNVTLHVRGGSVLPMQQPANNTHYSRRNPMKLLVALDNDGKASGTLYWDDGVSKDTYETSKFVVLEFSAEKSAITGKTKSGTSLTLLGVYLQEVQVFGVAGSVSSAILVNGNLHTNFIADDKVLRITDLHIELAFEFEIKWNTNNEERIDCYPQRLGGFDLVTKTKCEQRNCIYSETNDPSPDCFFPLNDYGYKSERVYSTQDGWSVDLKWKGKAPFDNPIPNITFVFEMINNDICRFKLVDRDRQRYEVPVPLTKPKSGAADPRYEVKVTSEDPFYFTITRKSTGTIIWDTSVGGLTFEDQFLQIATRLPSRNIYGFGENVHGSLRHDLNWTMWPMFSRDQPTGGQNSDNHYGVHPFYMAMEDDGHSHGVFLLNSNAQDYAFTPLPMLIYRTIGGILDFYVFMGPEPENVVQQYTGMIGRPYMPPYWSLGFQLSRYGYNHIDNVKAAVNRTLSVGIPLDVQYVDIDHMDQRKIFTVDDVNFPGLNEYFEELRSQGMSIIIILDPCFAYNTSYEPYVKLTNFSATIKWPRGYNIPPDSADPSGAMLGYVWPVEKVVFPDFFKENAKKVWNDLIVKHHQKLVFDGLWIDMNEPANFDTNKEKPFNWPPYLPSWSLHCNRNDSLENPQYRPMAAFKYDNKDFVNLISDKTLCMVAQQGQNVLYNHADVHSLFGWSQSKPTLDGLRQATGKRGMVISRSTFPGSGQYVGHWLGDNSAQWDNMRYSIIGSLEFNMFGIPYIGADICGFFGNSTAELCKRWMQLGAFNTFFRNHNGLGNVDQDPAVFGEETTNVVREAVQMRYRLLPYLYTLFHHAHVRGGTVMRPLHHEFPMDKRTYDIDQQFLWGPALLISPILFESQTEVKMYLPAGKWYDFYTGRNASNFGKQYMNIPIHPASQTPLHLRAGYIIPIQDSAMNTVHSRKNNFTLKVALKSDGHRSWANGDLFWDDGDSIDTYENGQYFYAKFMSTESKLRLKIVHNNIGSMSTFVQNVKVFGIQKIINFVYINGVSHDKFTLDKEVLDITDLKLSMNDEFVIGWGTDEINKSISRIDCMPEGANEADCQRKGCIWEPSEKTKVPPCFINKTKHGYTIASRHSTGAILQLKNESRMFENPIKFLKFEVEQLTDKIFRLRLSDNNKTRFEVPVSFNSVKSTLSADQTYQVNYTNDKNGIFYIQVIRKSSGISIFDTSIGGLTFEDQFLQIAVKLPSEYLYGIGENRHLSLKHGFNYQRWPMWSRDNGVNWGDNANLYGVHPFYMNIEDSAGNAHGVLLLNSNAMEVELIPEPAIVYRTIGGILDFYVFMGPSPEEVIQQYTSLIGHSYMPPYWALGFQLCKYGYNNLATLKEAVRRTSYYEIPHDVQYADIDHMDERKDFTIDSVNFNGLSEYFRELQDQGLRIIIILDPALISNETNYKPYDEGIKQDVFIKWPDNVNHPDKDIYNRTDMLGYVWPKGRVVFPDFLNPKTHAYWSELITDHHKKLAFDGLWIDMNEPANFGTNEERAFNWPPKDKPYWTLKCPNSKLDDPPYKPMAIFGSRISDKTLCMVALQNEGKYQHYNVHSLYGWSQTKPTLEALRKSTGERGIVISRSTYPSSGHSAGHWLGDNDSQWSNMHDSIIGIIEFNLFGISYVGADICGFFGDSSAELCERWMQLGAFYTFSRNHNTINTAPQDPGFFGPAVAASSRKVLSIRYSLLPYVYTLFHHANTQGGTVIRSIAHNFPSELEAREIDTQFMWGSEFLIAPVLEEGQIEKDVYLPQGRWYDYHTGEMMKKATGGQWVRVSAPRDHIPLFVKGGSILPRQQPATTTKLSRNKPMNLLVALDENGAAAGDIYWDDGVSINSSAGSYKARFNVVNGSNATTLDINIQNGGNCPCIKNIVYDHILIFGVQNRPLHIRSENNTYPFSYNDFNRYLNITEVSLDLSKSHSIYIIRT